MCGYRSILMVYGVQKPWKGYKLTMVTNTSEVLLNDYSRAFTQQTRWTLCLPNKTGKGWFGVNDWNDTTKPIRFAMNWNTIWNWSKRLTKKKNKEKEKKIKRKGRRPSFYLKEHRLHVLTATHPVHLMCYIIEMYYTF